MTERRERTPRRLAPLWLLVALVALAPTRAAAHLALESARPAAGAAVHAPRELRLGFTEPVSLAFSRVALRGPGGELRLTGLELPAPSELRAALPDTLPAGEYEVLWQAAGPDGHAVRGSYRFQLLPPAQAHVPSVVHDTSMHARHHAAHSEAMDSGARSPLYSAIRWLSFVGLLGVIGAVAFRVLVLPRVPEGRAMAAATARIGLAATALLAVTLVLRFIAQWVTVRAAGEWLDTGSFLAMLGGTAWGWGWLAQAGALVVTAVGLSIARREERLGWGIAAGGALALAFTPAISGHAVAAPRLVPLVVLADGLHVLGAGGWLGSLLLLLLVGLRSREGSAATLVRAFSPVALGFAGLVVATGLFATWIHVGTLPALSGTVYGRTLLAKLAVLAAVFALGAYHWRRVQPKLGTAAAAGHLRRSAAVELALGAIVLAITAVLIATASPAAMSGG